MIHPPNIGILVDWRVYLTIPGPKLSSCGCGVRGAGAAAFFCISYRGKLLQHKLIRVQCTKKLPEYGIPCTAVRVLGLKTLF
jgi:hypothetical protein